MAKQKLQKPEVKQPEQTPQQSNVTDQSGFDILDNLFHVNEDSYNEHQDNLLLVLIENENAVNDKVKIKYLFKKYRDEARNNHGL